jgi:REP element-mobilizing transposase RayT
MARGPRIELAGGIFHVYARGNCRRWIYRDPADRLSYLRMLHATARRYEWHCLSYCLMTNHVHLLLETPHANLGRGMQSCHGRYAQWLNQRHGMTGHVFEGRFGSVHVEGDGQLWMTARYLAMNPVDAGICAHAAEYEWSSYGAMLRGEAPALLNADRLLSYFGAAGGDPLSRYRDLVAGPRF